MMSNTLHDALLFLINTLFDLYLFILVVRIILVYVRSNYFDPITQFVTKLTDFIVKPLRRLIPNIGRFETVTILLIIVIECIKFLIISSVSFGVPSLIGLLLLSIGDALKLVIQSFFYAIILQAILSWVQPHSPMTQTLNQFTWPIMQPFRRLIPPIGGMDISPIPALIVLQLVNILIATPLIAMGLKTAMGY